jgi:NADPH-dependent glutamate synthase beta subunit-like oxidoreductase/NAD(P)H-flavin reductase
MPHAKLNFNGFTFADLFQGDTLNTLDQQFLERLNHHDPSLHSRLLDYRQHSHTWPATQISELLLACAPVLEEFIAELFRIQLALENSRQQTYSHQAVFEFKKWVVLRRAKRRLKSEKSLESFAELDTWLSALLDKLPTSPLCGSEEIPPFNLEMIDRELAVAHLAQDYLANQETYAEELDKLTRWCILAMTTPEGQAAVQNWVSFRLPQPVNHAQLVPTVSVANDVAGRLEGPYHTRRQREGFKLTDPRMSARQVQNEIDYCIYCHDRDTDFCAKGFPVLPQTEDTIGIFKTDPLGNVLTGCPLGQKISEMHVLKRQGYTIAALAMVMIDNPLCAVTGHRICNDCMKACIYQKQDPVNIPQTETRILTDVLDLPWGVEIYDLLIRWHPLRPRQWVPKPYNGLKVLIAGQGPAGFTLAHHLLMEGFAVVGIDGLKIEPLPEQLIHSPIQDYASLQENLDGRIMTGFGGVTEYGITARWDKNFLKLIYLSLLRRPYFQVYGSIRFGGTVTVEDAWELGFDHLAIAVGAGLPQPLSIPGSLAPGMRQASDFLMTLQLTGAAKENSLTNLQVRLPAVVIGGGLTGIDTATEVQAYYLVQIEKTLHRYEQLTLESKSSDLGTRVLEHLEEASLETLQEFLAHGRALRAERERAKVAGVAPDIQRLLHEWGGVTIAYRRSMQESPAYLRNHEEIIKALEEGIFYAAGLEPKVAQLDKYGQVQALVCRKRVQDAQGQWQPTTEEVYLPARSIFVATGASPNISYEFEHKGHFQRAGFQYQPYDDKEGTLQPVPVAKHCKVPEFGPFTSYQAPKSEDLDSCAKQNHRVTFIGDTHPAFQGSVVKAVASAMRTYPLIVKSCGERVQVVGKADEYVAFRVKMQDLLQARIEQVLRRTATVLELQVHAPMVAKKYRPGQFFRVQNFETFAPIVGDTRLRTEAMAMRCVGVDADQGSLSLMVMEQGTSSRLCATLRPQDPISLMGPTGVHARIAAGGETMMVIGGQLAAAEVRTLGPALRAAGNRVLYIALFDKAEEVYGQTELEAATDVIVWITASGHIVPIRPQDYSVQGDLLDILTAYAKGEVLGKTPAIPFAEVNRVLIIGSNHLVRKIQDARRGTLRDYFGKTTQFVASVYVPMQCMLKGVCGQCLQWQINPATGQRTKAIFACSWQDQPLDLIDLDNVDERLSQNRLQEHLTNLWLDYLFARYEVKRV